MSKLAILVQEGKINRYEYLTYLTFVGNDAAKEYLSLTIESCMMEEPVTPTTELFIWHDGRRSLWRDIKRIINHVDDLMEQYNDGSSNAIQR